MTAEQIGAVLAGLTPAAIGLWLGHNMMKDFKLKKRAKKEGLTYKEMKEKIKNE